MSDQKTSPIRRCIGYGSHEGKCENEAGTRWGPHWCLRCDKIRLETISKNLSDMVNSFPSNRAITNKEGSRQVTVRIGATVGKDFGSQRWTEKDRVFAATEISQGRCKLVAHGYGVLGEGSSAYGNGAIYVNSSDLIEISNPSSITDNATAF